MSIPTTDGLTTLVKGGTVFKCWRWSRNMLSALDERRNREFFMFNAVFFKFKTHFTNLLKQTKCVQLKKSLVDYKDMIKILIRIR